MKLNPVISIKFDKPTTRPNKFQSKEVRRFFNFGVEFTEYALSTDYGETWVNIGADPIYYTRDYR